MIELIVYILAVYSICFSVIDATIFDTYLPIRKYWIKVPFFRDLFSCYYCTGFHVGWILFLLTQPFNFATILLYTFSAAIVAFWLDQKIQPDKYVYHAEFEEGGPEVQDAYRAMCPNCTKRISQYMDDKNILPIKE